MLVMSANSRASDAGQKEGPPKRAFECE